MLPTLLYHMRSDQKLLADTDGNKSWFIDMLKTSNIPVNREARF